MLKKTTTFCQFVIQRFFQDDCLYRASALTFTTLLALVPLMYITLSVVSFFPVSKHFINSIQNFIFENFVPATGKILQSYLHQFTAQTNQLPTWDLLFLLVTVFFMMLTIEDAMNLIWRAPQLRHSVRAILLYLSILWLTPVLLGLSLAASSYFLSLPFFQSHLLSAFWLQMVPFLLSFIGFSFFYMILPNCHVSFASGVVGGASAAILFEIAKHGFVFYLSQYNSYEQLYGALAVIPVFFMWLYVVWVITLLGAEISYAFSKT